MSTKVKWGVLGVANIATKKVIPAMQKGEMSEVAAIASRDRTKAEQAAKELGIPKAFGSYEELLADPEIEVVYNPLPNHLHVPWTIKAAEAGKHVLCEKPIALTVKEATSLIGVRDRTGVKIQEAFMVRTHPQWVGALERIRSGKIGKVKSVSCYFSYCNLDPNNIRNISDFGGGALMDIGCYLVLSSRLIFDEEPSRVIGLIEHDPDFQTDILTSAILDFPSGQAVWTCGTQVAPYQRVLAFGNKGRLEIEIPFNAPPDAQCRIFVDVSSTGREPETIEFETADQYTIQGDLFSKAIREGGSQAVPLEWTIKNMAVIEAIFRSTQSGQWEKPSA
jgi:predicted dehydrogenase